MHYEKKNMWEFKYGIRVNSQAWVHGHVQMHKPRKEGDECIERVKLYHGPTPYLTQLGFGRIY